MKEVYLLIFFLSCTRVQVVESPPPPPQPPQEVREESFSQIKDLAGLEQLSGELKESYCGKVQKKFRRYHWGKSTCRETDWFVHGLSVKGEPLVFTLWGDREKTNGDVTLIMCGVHGDEITPIKFCYDILGHLEDEALKNPHNPYKGKTIVLAPLVNPDAFFKARPTRTNANGVDVNRNFPTGDWEDKALDIWKNHYGSDKRRYPGPSPGSEPETLFQMILMGRFSPQKIISVHAPLTMLDYDGPESLQTGGFIGSQASRLLVQMSKSAEGLRIKNYPFFPGSLGNYAGNERNIPTFTLELPTSDNRLHKEYWPRFKGIIVEAVVYSLQGKESVESEM